MEVGDFFGYLKIGRIYLRHVQILALQVVVWGSYSTL